MKFPVKFPVKFDARPVLLALVVSLAAASPVLAQEASSAASPSAEKLTVDPASLDRNSFTIAGGAAYLPSYEGSDDYVFIPAAAVRGKVDGINFFTRGTQLFVDAIPSPSGPSFDFELGPVIGLNLNRTGRIHDRQVEALGKRKVALEAGGFVGIAKTGVITSDYDTLSLRVSYVHDVTQVNHSYVVTPSIEYGTPLSRKAYVGISASADYAGDDYAHSYFDVTPAGALRSGLPSFTGHKGWKDVTFGALGNYALTGDLLHGLSIFATGSYSTLQNDFARSPVTSIAGDRRQWFGALGLGYTF